jgi:ABC-type sulfate transport system permease subunit
LQDSRKKIITLAAFISAIVVVVPKVMCYETYFEKGYQIIFNSISGIFQVIAFNCSFVYLLIALDDMKRKLFLLE